MSEVTNEFDQSPEEMAAVANRPIASPAVTPVTPTTDVIPSPAPPAFSIPENNQPIGQTWTGTQDGALPMGGGMGGATATPDVSAQNQALFLALSQKLRAIGLTSLFTYDPGTGEMGGKLWDWVKAGTLSQDPSVLAALVEATPEFQARFPAIFAQRAQVYAGHSVHVMTAEEVLQYEDTVTGLFQRAGFPKQFYDTPQAIQSLAAQNISVLEVDHRIGQGFSVIHEAPKEVRDAFGNYFGVQGDAALAMWYLDATHSIDNLDRMTRAASLGGIGLNYNVNLDRLQAEDLARANISQGQAQQGFGEIAQERPLFDEQIHEGQDLTAEGTGVAAAFGTPGGADARRAIEQRRGTRAAAFAGQGGAASDQRGVLGLTEANQ